MNVRRRWSCVTVSALCALLFSASTLPAEGEQKPPALLNVAPLLPAETLAFLTLPDLNQSIAKFQQTGLWQILSNAEVRNVFSAQWADLRFRTVFVETALGIKLDDILPLFSQGEITVALLALDKRNVDGSPLPDLLISIQAKDKAPALLEQLNRRVDQLSALLAAQGRVLQIAQKPVGETMVKSLTVDGQLMVVQYALAHGQLLLALGEGHIERVLAMREKFGDGKFPEAPAAEIVAQVPSYKKTLEKAGAGTDLLLYVNFEGLLKNPMLQVQPKNAADEKGWELLSLRAIRSISYAISLREKALRELLYIDLPVADRTGLLALLEGEGIEAQMLDAAPRNALAAVALKFSPEKVMEGLLRLAAVDNPQVAAELENWLAAMGQELKLDVRKEIIGTFTGEAVLSTGMTARHPKLPVGFPAPLLSLRAKDAQALKNVLSALRETGKKNFDFIDVATDAGDITTVRERVAEGGRPAFGLAFAQSNNDLLVSLYPLALRHELTRRAAKAGSLIDDPDFQATRSKLSPTARALVYLDTAALLVAAYDVFIPLAQIANPNPRLNPLALPSSDLLLNNLQGSAFALTMDQDGLGMEGYSSTGLVGALAVATPVLVTELRRNRFRAAQAQAPIPDRRKEAALQRVSAALEAYARDNAGNYPATLKELQPKYVPDGKGELEFIAYYGKQTVPNRVVANSSEKLSGPISILLQNGTVVSVGRGRLHKVLKEGYNEAPPENQQPVAPPRPPAEENF